MNGIYGVTKIQTERSWPWLAGSIATFQTSHWWLGLWDGSVGGKTPPLDK